MRQDSKKKQTYLWKKLFSRSGNERSARSSDRPNTPFQVLVSKEISSHIRSWRFIILILLVVLTYVTSIYVSLSNLKGVLNQVQDPDQNFVYLKILTGTDNSIPPFHIFLSFLAPLLGISLGFDAINAERNNGTLSRLMAQPIYRDNLLLAKFASAIVIVAVLFLSLHLLMIGGGIFMTGIKIEVQEFFRILTFVFISVVYVAFWLSLSILLSIRFKQGATSALTAIGIWLFFTIFYPIVINLFVKSFVPAPNTMSEAQWMYYNDLILNLMRLSPSQLYSDATTTLLLPSVRSLGPVTMEQMIGAIPSPLPLKESIMIIWPQLSGLLASTMICFAIAYYIFMRREIRG